MIRTYPICPAHPHRQGESLRAIVGRLEQELQREMPPARPIAARPAFRAARLTF
jgi:hypothetical protein